MNIDICVFIFQKQNIAGFFLRCEGEEIVPSLLHGNQLVQCKLCRCNNMNGTLDGSAVRRSSSQYRFAFSHGDNLISVYYADYILIGGGECHVCPAVFRRKGSGYPEFVPNCHPLAIVANVKILHGFALLKVDEATFQIVENETECDCLTGLYSKIIGMLSPAVIIQQGAGGLEIKIGIIIYQEAVVTGLRCGEAKVVFLPLLHFHGFANGNRGGRRNVNGTLDGSAVRRSGNQLCLTRTHCDNLVTVLHAKHIFVRGGERHICPAVFRRKGNGRIVFIPHYHLLTIEADVKVLQGFTTSKVDGGLLRIVEDKPEGLRLTGYNANIISVFSPVVI